MELMESICQEDEKSSMHMIGNARKEMKYCFVIAALAVLHAQGQVPRTADGHPDLGGGGVWLPAHVADLASDVNVPFQGWSKAKFQANQVMKQNDLDLRCLPPGVPRITLTARPFEIVQTPQRILFMYEGGAHVWRQVWMDGRGILKIRIPIGWAIPSGAGRDDTLVVDAVGFNDRTWLDDAGHPHTERLHVIEKYTRTDASDDEVRSDD